MSPPSYMDAALEQAALAEALGEVPVGAVLVDPNGKILSFAYNRTEIDSDPTAHAEILAIRAACHILASPRLPGHDLYVTLEPCSLCATAISFARLRRVYFGAWDPKGGAVDHGIKLFESPNCHHRPEIYGGIAESQAGALLRRFFAERR